MSDDTGTPFPAALPDDEELEARDEFAPFDQDEPAGRVTQADRLSQIALHHEMMSRGHAAMSFAGLYHRHRAADLRTEAAALLGEVRE